MSNLYSKTFLRKNAPPNGYFPVIAHIYAIPRIYTNTAKWAEIGVKWAYKSGPMQAFFGRNHFLEQNYFTNVRK